MRLVTRSMVRRLIPLAAVLLLSATAVQAQVINAIAFNQRMTTYTPITGGTVLAGSTGYADDEAYAVPLPFQFKFNNQFYSTVYPCTNGYITVGAADPYLYSYPISYTSSYGATGVICPWGWDLHGNSSGEMSYLITGSAPNRVCTIQWKNWHYYYASTDILNFQVKLYETTGLIEFVYGPTTWAGTSRSANVGLRAATTDYQTRMVSSGDWVNSLKGTSQTSVCTFNGTTKPQDGTLYRWGCYVPEDRISFAIIDANGNNLPFATVGSSVNFRLQIGFPNESFAVTVRLDFFRVGDPSPIPAYTYTHNTVKPVTDLNEVFSVTLPMLASGYYRIDATITTKNSCSEYENVKKTASSLFLQPNETPCEVWPGDVNNDGIVNYGDRSALNQYIFQANLRPTWLQGPARYRSDAATNPMTYYTWEAQAAVPWATAQGCFMDADGNGAINNYDMLPIRVNWFRMHGIIPPKQGTDLQPSTFDMAQNYPNPFNPSTSIRVSVPERSRTTLTVVDLLGRTVATLHDGQLDAGVHAFTFDGASLQSGVYVATIVSTGLETGVSYTKTMKMALNK